MPTILITLFLPIVTLGYVGVCWLKPFTHCDRCKGSGTSPTRLSDRLRYRMSPTPRAVRGLPDCPRCRGTGLRLRLGRRAYNFASTTHRATR